MIRVERVKFVDQCRDLRGVFHYWGKTGLNIYLDNKSPPVHKILNTSGETILFHPLIYRCPEIVKVLVSKGLFDLTYRPYELMNLFICYDTGTDNWETLEVLLKAGLPVNPPCNFEDRPILNAAIYHNRYDIAKVLIENGADVHQIGPFRSTCICREGIPLDIFKMLIGKMGYFFILKHAPKIVSWITQDHRDIDLFVWFMTTKKFPLSVIKEWNFRSLFLARNYLALGVLLDLGLDINDLTGYGPDAYGSCYFYNDDDDLVEMFHLQKNQYLTIPPEQPNANTILHSRYMVYYLFKVGLSLEVAFSKLRGSDWKESYYHCLVYRWLIIQTLVSQCTIKRLASGGTKLPVDIWRTVKQFLV